MKSITNVTLIQTIYNNIVEGVKIRSRCQCHEENENSTKYFLNLEKKLAEKSTLWRLVADKKDLLKYNEISNEIFSSISLWKNGSNW